MSSTICPQLKHSLYADPYQEVADVNYNIITHIRS